ncbi:NAD(P)H-hydrate dehydratase [uncultured Nevskia sp.]|uniref:NAD(P)H-hydrate dehydratase n=1 Tax=uncultured Nevskia sp. TaxID=228950 RepID=UPI0025FB06F1|nr:NAD(P)H-hydrate dehydratase [uncultured Nevskia sp.]
MNRRTALLDVRQMTLADRLTVAAGTPSIDLMESAGTAVSKAITLRWTARPVIVLCGPGNNGGDGFVVARQLAESGWPVRVALLGSFDSLVGAARHHAERWQRAIEALTPVALEGAELVVDAVFGSGLSRALTGPAALTLAAASKKRVPLIAIDVPSGVMGDTGEALGAVSTVLTVTFFRKKPGHVLMPGRGLCGEVIVADIGTPLSVFEQIVPNSFENDPALWLSDLPWPTLAGNKYTRGHALVSGGYPITGAARMAARAAARMGAGLTTIAVPDVALPIYAAALISIMVHPLTAPEDFAALLDDPRFTAFLIGPGAGPSAETRNRALSMLASGRPTVLDADALTAFQTEPAVLDQAIIGPCVLTPHDGEFGRLFDAGGDKLTRSLAAARRCGAVVVLKGSDTVIAAPDGRAVINTNAPPSLATAGSGDVLSGMLLGLLAQGMTPFLAGAAAVWMHGAAASEFGPGLIAEDLPDLLPGIVRRLYMLRAEAASPSRHSPASG